MPTTKKRLTFTPESNEEELLQELADKEGISMSRMMGLLIRRAATQQAMQNEQTERNRAMFNALLEIASLGQFDGQKMIQIAKKALQRFA